MTRVLVGRTPDRRWWSTSGGGASARPRPAGYGAPGTGRCRYRPPAPRRSARPGSTPPGQWRPWRPARRCRRVAVAPAAGWPPGRSAGSAAPGRSAACDRRRAGRRARPARRRRSGPAGGAPPSGCTPALWRWPAPAARPRTMRSSAPDGSSPPGRAAPRPACEPCAPRPRPEAGGRTTASAWSITTTASTRDTEPTPALRNAALDRHVRQVLPQRDPPVPGTETGGLDLRQVQHAVQRSRRRRRLVREVLRGAHRRDVTGGAPAGLVDGRGDLGPRGGLALAGQVVGAERRPGGQQVCDPGGEVGRERRPAHLVVDDGRLHRAVGQGHHGADEVGAVPDDPGGAHQVVLRGPRGLAVAVGLALPVDAQWRGLTILRDGPLVQAVEDVLAGDV